MKAKRMILSIALSLLVVAIAGQAGFALGQAQDTKKGEFKITIQGKIDHMEQLGGYFVLGEKPGGEFMIVNQNPKVLAELMKSKKTVTVEGSLKGAEWLTIEKIDGKPYSGKPASK
jgi:hypothetical protein